MTKIKGKHLIVGSDVYTVDQLKNTEECQRESANPARQKSNSAPTSPVVIRKTQDSFEENCEIDPNFWDLGTPRKTLEKRPNTSPADPIMKFEKLEFFRTNVIEIVATRRIIMMQLKKKNNIDD